MDDCLFCKIVAGEIPANKVYEDEKFLVFKDIKPKANVHLLLIPKVHIISLQEVGPHHIPLLGEMTTLINMIAYDAGLEEGFRVISNAGAGGHQEVPHLHYHILGGDQLPGF